MRLSELASQTPGAAVGTGADYEVRRVVHDSRQAGPGDLFVAVRGLRVDGHDLAAAAAARGAAVAVERPVPLPAGAAWLSIADTRRGLGELAAALHRRPARRLRVVGITGTTGKSTVTHMTAHVLDSAGQPAGYLSTVAHRGRTGAGRSNESGLTTLTAPQVQEWLAELGAEGAGVAVIEASSHALEQGRVAACEFDVAAITNVASDHLDYHGSPEAYLRAKARLIDLCATAPAKGVEKTAVLNRDDASYDALAAVPVERRISYGLDRGAEVRARDVKAIPEGMAFRLVAGGEVEAVRLRLPARFNVANALCAAACGLALGLQPDAVAAGLSSFPGLSGRLERVDLGQPFAVYVDFAHSAVALASVLGEMRRGCAGRLLVVFGATARSDHDPAGMGRAAADHADFFVITTDDPLEVDPGDLARRVESGANGRVRGRDYEVLLNRRAAIRLALERATPGDVVVLAGKGHERTMRLAGGDVAWDERAEAEAALREIAAGG
jgi:UDP-N-acetylmuramoyl-L-alanyl-D-glutamate--2,6-diaminopimelate ligase